MRTCLAALLVLGLSLHAHAQDDAVTRLRAQVAAAPGDSSLRCQLAFALVGTSNFDEARSIANTAVLEIATLPLPRPPARRRLLGACLYNLGRAREGLGEAYAAGVDYVRSLALRPNDTVHARLAALAPGMRDDLPASALIVLDRRAHEDDVRPIADAAVAHLRTDRESWDFLPASVSESGGRTTLAAYAIGWQGDVPSLYRVDEWTQDDSDGRLSIASVRAITAPDVGPVAVLEVRASGGGTCGRMDGFRDFERVATVLLELDGAHRSRVLVSSENDCDGLVHMRFRVQPRGVTVSESRGGELAVGTHAIAGLLR